MFAPKLEDYDINALILLGNKEMNDVKRNQIKLSIIEKILGFNYPMFILVNKFLRSSGILKESYAEVITMLMKENDYLIDNSIIDPILSYISLDTLIYYGAESRNNIFSERCVSEFWNRASYIEDNGELKNKSGIKKRCLKDIFKRKRKGDKE